MLNASGLRAKRFGDFSLIVSRARTFGSALGSTANARSWSLRRSLTRERTSAECQQTSPAIQNSQKTVFDAASARAPRFGTEIVIGAETLRAFGVIRVPGPVWRTLQRLGAWVEPVLVNEWARLIQGFGLKIGRAVGPGEAKLALRWFDPARDTAPARDVARRLISRGAALRCVWMGGRLQPYGTDTDHCLPWTAWPCGDLWNLYPARPTVNRYAKRDRLPSASALAEARDGTQTWRDQAWASDEALFSRFWQEIDAALPVQGGRTFDDVLSGLEWRRLRLRQDQQVQE